VQTRLVIDLTPALEERAAHVREPRRAVMIIIRRILHHLRGGPAVRGRERLVPGGEDVRVRLGARVRGDLGELALDAHAEAVEVEVVLGVLERILDLLPDLEEAEEEERGERSRSARYRQMECARRRGKRARTGLCTSRTPASC
jgi:hypothetical protein